MNDTAWLMAQHTRSGASRCFPLRISAPSVVGRRTPQDGQEKLSIPFDPYLSREHFTVQWDGVGAVVRKCPQARLPVYFSGAPVDECRIAPGEFFVIGNVRFTLLGPAGVAGEPRISAITEEHVEYARRHKAELCLSALTALQPLLASRRALVDFLAELPPLVLSILPGAHTAMSLRLNTGSAGEVESIDILATKSRGGDAHPSVPSRTMASVSLRSAKPEAYIWQAHGCAEGPTACAGVGWAVCAPVNVSERQNYALYAMGESLVEADTLGAMDHAVLALIAEVAAHYLQAQFLHHMEGQLAQYFPPALRKVLMDDPFSETLHPALHDVTVLFFDLRGFSKATEQAEEAADEQDERAFYILRHHDFVSEVLSVIADCIFATGGIVVDYQGDAVMAAWGAPLALDDHADRALEAAGAIVRQLAMLSFTDFEAASSRSLPFGIGVSSGRALAGNMATREHIKYIVMGSAVNVASRLEGLTKYIRVPVLIGRDTVERLKKPPPLRRVAKVVPAGLTKCLDVFELVFSADCYGSGLGAEDIAHYEEALISFERGEMERAEEMLQRLPAPDPARRFLMLHIAQSLYGGAPAGWDGVIRFQSK